jgi:hypothetical protein
MPARLDDTVSLDTLDLQGATIGEDLILTRGADDSLVLHAADARGVQRLGSFASASRAWEVIDALDLAAMAFSPEHLAA